MATMAEKYTGYAERLDADIAKGGEHCGAAEQSVRTHMAYMRQADRRYGLHYGAITREFENGLIWAEIVCKDGSVYMDDMTISRERYDRECQLYDSNPNGYLIDIDR